MCALALRVEFAEPRYSNTCHPVRFLRDRSYPPLFSQFLCRFLVDAHGHEIANLIMPRYRNSQPVQFPDFMITAFTRSAHVPSSFRTSVIVATRLPPSITICGSSNWFATTEAGSGTSYYRARCFSPSLTTAASARCTFRKNSRSVFGTTLGTFFNSSPMNVSLTCEPSLVATVAINH